MAFRGCRAQSAASQCEGGSGEQPKVMEDVDYTGRLGKENNNLVSTDQG